LKRVFMFPKADGGCLYQLEDDTFDSARELDVLFPVLHGTFGEDGNMQGYFEIADIAYVGADVAASAVCMEKELFKDIMRAHDLPVVDSLLFTRQEVLENGAALVRQVEAYLPYPVFVKPVNLGSSVGVHKCAEREQLLFGLQDAVWYSRKVVVEQGVEAAEIEVGVLGDDNQIDVSLPGEVRYTDDFYSYHAKYVDTRTELVIPAPLTAEITDQVREYAGKAFQIVGCSGMARVDFLLDKKNSQVYISELNTIPGFTHASMYPRLWQVGGMSIRALVDRLIEIALKRFEEKKETVYRYPGG